MLRLRAGALPPDESLLVLLSLLLLSLLVSLLLLVPLLLLLLELEESELLLLLLLPEDVLLELVSESELLLLLLRLCFFLRAFLRASASCFCFSSSSFLLYRIQSGTSSGFRYLRLAGLTSVFDADGLARYAAWPLHSYVQ